MLGQVCAKKIPKIRNPYAIAKTKMIIATILLARFSKKAFSAGINVAINATAPRIIKSELLGRFASFPV
mgnify:CR=1 FL=1